MSAPLKWGRTPWDELGRAELLREVQRYHSAATSARSALRLLMGDRMGFWSMQGTGGRALAKLEQATEQAERHTPGEQLYAQFYRYADDLLFKAPLGVGWAVCEKGHMTAGEHPRVLECVICNSTSPTPVAMRPITWEDLQPGRWP